MRTQLLSVVTLLALAGSAFATHETSQAKAVCAAGLLKVANSYAQYRDKGVSLEKAHAELAMKVAIAKTSDNPHTAYIGIFHELLNAVYEKRDTKLLIEKIMEKCVSIEAGHVEEQM